MSEQEFENRETDIDEEEAAIEALRFAVHHSKNLNDDGPLHRAIKSLMSLGWKDWKISNMISLVASRAYELPSVKGRRR